MSPRRTSNGLPVTAYLVLGVLAANDEQLTAGEIKMRAELSVGHFYWSPSVSHVRRELNRLLARGMVERDRRPIRQAGDHALRDHRRRPRRTAPVGATLPGPGPGRHQAPGHPQDVVGPRRGPRTHRRHVGPASRGDPGAAGRGVVVAAALAGTRHQRRPGSALLVGRPGLRDPRLVCGAFQHLPVARRDRHWHNARPGQPGATAEGSDPPPGIREPELGAATA